jgi:hypothetical protein
MARCCAVLTGDGVTGTLIFHQVSKPANISRADAKFHRESAPRPQRHSKLESDHHMPYKAF